VPFSSLTNSCCSNGPSPPAGSLGGAADQSVSRACTPPPVAAPAAWGGCSQPRAVVGIPALVRGCGAHGGGAAGARSAATHDFRAAARADRPPITGCAAPGNTAEQGSPALHDISFERQLKYAGRAVSCGVLPRVHPATSNCTQAVPLSTASTASTRPWGASRTCRGSAELPGRRGAVRAAAQHAGPGPAAAVRPSSVVEVVEDILCVHHPRGPCHAQHSTGASSDASCLLHRRRGNSPLGFHSGP